jgi:hypothetical protein
MRSAFVHEATLELAPGEDTRRPGAVVTVELCGHWEHEGACRWPHHTAAIDQGNQLRVRTVVAADASEHDGLLTRIGNALRATGDWTVREAGPTSPTDDEQRRAARWLDMPT